MYKILFFIINLVLTTTFLSAQDIALNNTADTELICCQTKTSDQQIQKVYQLNKKKETYIFGVGLGLVVSGIILKTTNDQGRISAEKLANLDRNNINGFDRGVAFNYAQSAADASDILLGAASALPVIAFYLDKNTRKEYKTLAVMGAEIFLANNALSFNSKYAFNRFRPIAYNTDLSFDKRAKQDNRYSFYSAHVSQTAAFSFFFAKVMTDFHPDMSTWSKVGVWSIAVTLPAAQAALRVESGKHFYSDVMVGYALGASFGLLIPYLHKTHPDGSSFSITPIYQEDAKGLALQLNF
ncbi:MAG: phosphatase PAP2 family protein [Flavobacteriaceae bacterium]|nr:phosphatase PAP2 family protein [Flavobacteriaceae bacterium]MDZ4148481.1 phosphatase PAP2 family protein [Flavobacteriaceae bacterium]